MKSLTDQIDLYKLIIRHKGIYCGLCRKVKPRSEFPYFVRPPKNGYMLCCNCFQIRERFRGYIYRFGLTEDSPDKAIINALARKLYKLYEYNALTKREMDKILKDPIKFENLSKIFMPEINIFNNFEKGIRKWTQE